MLKVTRFIALQVCPALAITLGLALSSPAFAGKEGKDGKDHKEKTMVTRYFIDVHDRKDGTFPAKITAEDFRAFFQKYEGQAREEGVVLLRVDVNLEEGRAYCLTAAPSPEAVLRVHQRIGLPYNQITEVATLAPDDLGFSGAEVKGEARKPLSKMKYFIDTHDKRDGSFPAKISPTELVGFFKSYEAAARAEGVVIVRVAANIEDGRAYCYVVAESAEAVRRYHQRVGLMFNGITEVQSVTPSDLGFSAL